jgi:hypothetical protein
MFPGPPEETPQFVKPITQPASAAILIHVFAMSARLEKLIANGKYREKTPVHLTGSSKPSKAFSVSNQSSANTRLISNCRFSAPSGLEIASIARNDVALALPFIRNLSMISSMALA